MHFKSTSTSVLSPSLEAMKLVRLHSTCTQSNDCCMDHIDILTDLPGSSDEKTLNIYVFPTSEHWFANLINAANCLS